MSVSNAVARVGTEIMNTRVEIPAMETPITELIRVSLRARSSAWALSCAYDAEGIHSSRMLTGKSQMLGAKRGGDQNFVFAIFFLAFIYKAIVSIR